MASKIVGNLIVNLAANVADFRSDMKKAASAAERQSKRINKSMQRMEKRIKNFADTTTLAMGAVTAALAGRSIINAALQMERINKALTFATGSAKAGANEFGFVRQEAERLGLELSSAAQQYASLAAAARGTTLQGQETRDIFTAVSEAATVLSLTGEQTAGALNAIQQMISKGTVSAEELRGQLGERLPGAFQLAARAMGMTTTELGKALQAGEVMADEMLPALAKELHKTFGPDIAEAITGTQQKINRFKNSLFEFQNQLAQGGITDAFSTMIEGFGSVLAQLRPVIIAVIAAIDENIEQIKFRFQVLGTIVGHIWQSIFAGFATMIANVLTGIRTAIEKVKTMAASLGGALQHLPGMGGMAAGLMGFGASGTAGLDATIERFNKVGTAAESLKEKITALVQQHNQNINLIRQTATEMISSALGMTDTIAPAVEETTGAIESSVETAGSGIADATDKATSSFNFMEEAAKQAARSMQSHLADFFYDFNGGVKGMLLGFIDAMRRMIAEMIAFQTLKATLGQFDFFAGMFTAPGRAIGGPVTANQPYMVGERGPELFVPNTSGSIVPNNKMGPSIQVNMPVDARGAMSPAQVAAAVKASEQRIYYNLPRILNGYAPA